MILDKTTLGSKFYAASYYVTKSARTKHKTVFRTPNISGLKNITNLSTCSSKSRINKLPKPYVKKDCSFTGLVFWEIQFSRKRQIWDGSRLFDVTTSILVSATVTWVNKFASIILKWMSCIQIPKRIKGFSKLSHIALFAKEDNSRTAKKITVCLH